jgi:hypothetical protein
MNNTTPIRVTIERGDIYLVHIKDWTPFLKPRP